jgi:tetratricopeptide (TPR) repeat protein
MQFLNKLKIKDMKRFVSIAALVLLTTVVFGQKRNVTSCWNYLDDGFLKDALESIEKASEHSKTQDWYKTWWYYGRTQHALAITEKEKYQKLCDSCADKAFDAYVKSMKLNFEDQEYKNLDLEKDADVMKFVKAVGSSMKEGEPKVEDKQAMVDILTNRLPALANYFVNDGIQLFQEKQYAASLNEFEKSLSISSLSAFFTGKVDTTVMYYASLAAINSKNWEKTLEYSKALKQLDYGKSIDEKVLITKNLAVAYKNTGDTAKYIQTLEAGKAKYPDHSYDMVIELFNFNIDRKNYEKANEYISMAIEKNPEDDKFYVIRGTLKEELEQPEEAISDYKKAIELNPDNFDANYSLGAYYYNYAADTLAWANENIPPTETQKYESVKKAAMDYFKKAEPYLEKAYAIKNDNVDVITTLKTIYYKLQKMDKYEEIDARLKELTE